MNKTVIIGVPVLLLGGTEIHILTFVEALRSGGYDVTICCYYEFDESIVRRFRNAGANVILMKYERAKGLWYLAKGLIKLFREQRPDIVHIQYLAPGFIPIIAGRLAGIRTVFATVHIAGSVAHGRKAKLLLRSAAKLCTAFFCVSKGVEEFWFRSSQVFDPAKIVIGRRHYTIYNAVDTEKITRTIKGTDKNALRASLGLGKKTILGIVGRLAHQKGHVVLLNALVTVLQKFPDVILLVIGKGPDRESLEQRVESLGIKKHIIWLGERGQEEVFRLYSIMDIFIMPSLYEGFGLAAAEAMAAGLPVVGTEVDGLSEIIEDGKTGYLVAAGNTAELAESIIKILSNPELSKEMGQNGTSSVQRFFPLDIFINSWLKAYGKLSIN